MIPIPTARVFRSRRGALMWSFWVVLAAVMTIGFGDPPATDAESSERSAEAGGMGTNDQAMNDLMQAINAM